MSYEELRIALKTINGLYMKEVNSACSSKRVVDQLNVWKEFLDCHFMEYPNMGQLIQIMISSSGNTSPLERGYIHLQMTTSKRRNRLDPANLETLFLLATMNIPVKNADEYGDEIHRLK